jgi:putative copper export protein/mono/diheme cytochrome c family protein
VLLLARQVMVFTALLVILRLPQPKPLKGCERPVRFGVAAGYVGVIILLSMALVRGEFMLAGIALAFAVLGAGVASWSPGSESRTWAVFTLLAGVLLLSISFGSHAGGAPGSFWAVLGDYVHLSAAATWVGGLILVTLLLWQVHHTPNPRLSADPRSSVLLVRRFSYLASFSVFVLLLTGLFSSIVELPDLPALWETAYGRVLLVKLGLLTLALSVAFFNNRLVHGRINGLKSSIPPKRLYIQMGVEAVVTLGLMLSVAVLVQTTAPRGQASAEKAVQPALPFNSVINAADLTMHVQVDPNQVGSNRFWLHLYHGDGSQIGEVQLVQLRFNHRQASLGQSSVDLEPQGHDTFAVEGAYLSQPGTWDLYVYIRRRGIDDVLEQLNLDVPVPGISVSVSKPWQNPAPTLPPTLLAVWGLIALGLVPLVWRQPLVETWPRLYPAYRRAGISVVVIGLVFSIVWLVNGGGSAALGAHGSRIPPSPSSIEQGKALYEQNCLPCHGSVGLGDGPAALALIPRPANLQVHMVAGVHTDEQIYAWITNGFPNSAMPAFSDLLTGEERWHVLNYIRTLTPQGSP